MRRAELVEEYARRSGRDVSAIDFYRVLATWKLAVIAEGIWARHAQGQTLGRQFEGLTRRTAEIAERALGLADASPLRALRG
jgi:aminoglycoside phosphotransferase (APT) family kinase protein